MTAGTGARKQAILLVEDDELIRMSLVMGLADYGFEVVEAATAEAALEMMLSGLQTPVVVTDINLGPGCNGLDLADRIHAKWPDLGIIFITGRLDMLHSRVLGQHEAFLAKPFHLTALARLAERFKPA